MNGETNYVARTFPQRVAIFVDVQNMFYSAKNLKQGKVDYGRLLKEVVGNRHLIRAIAYITQKEDVNQAGFQEALERFGYDLKIKIFKVRTDAEGKAITVRASWNVGLTIDALQMAPKVDTVVLVTGDGEYALLAETLKSMGCRVEIVSFDRATSFELIKAANQYIPIPDEWVFKEKKFALEQDLNAPRAILPDPHIEDAPDAPLSFGDLGSTAPGQTDLSGLPKDEPELPPSEQLLKSNKATDQRLRNNFGIFGK
jgi:uncharacterized LabA/DUF88 family protein